MANFIGNEDDFQRLARELQLNQEAVAPMPEVQDEAVASPAPTGNTFEQNLSELGLEVPPEQPNMSQDLSFKERQPRPGEPGYKGPEEPAAEESEEPELTDDELNAEFPEAPSQLGKPYKAARSGKTFAEDMAEDIPPSPSADEEDMPESADGDAPPAEPTPKTAPTAGEDMRVTDPIQYILNKYPETMQRANEESRFNQTMNDAGRLLMASGYAAKNLDMPQHWKDVYAAGDAAAKRPIQDVERLQKEHELTFNMAGKVFDLATKGFDAARLQKLSSVSPESTVINKAMASVFPPEMQAKLMPFTDKVSNTDFKSLMTAATSVSQSEMTKAWHEANAAQTKNKAAESKERKEQEVRTKLSEALDAERARQGNAGFYAKMEASLDHVINLANDPRYAQNLTDQQTEELATGLARAYSSSGVTTRAAIDSLKLKSLKGNWKKAVAWLKNEPQGLEQQKFVAMLLHDAERQRDLYGDQVRAALLPRAASYKDRVSPQAYEEELNMRGLDSNMVNAWGEYGKAMAAKGRKPSPQEFFMLYRDRLAKSKKQQKAVPPTASPAAPAPTNTPPAAAKPAATEMKTVRIRNKATGAEKTLAVDRAQKYLDDPNFEEVK